MKAIVTGMIGLNPLGGVVYDYLQYAVALEQLGFEVYYLEDTAQPTYSMNAQTGEWELSSQAGVEMLRHATALFSKTLPHRWHFRDYEGVAHGMPAEEMYRILEEAEVLLNISGATLLREPYQQCRRKVFIDSDPGWNHFRHFPAWDSWSAERQREGYRGHDFHFTFAERIGRDDCRLEDFGLTWHPTRSPVVTSLWTPRPPATKWTTVMGWNQYREPLRHDGQTFGAKEIEFERIESLPSRLGDTSLEVAVEGKPPRERWRELGWSVVQGRDVSASPEAYRDYVAGSRGEFSVAKNVFVDTRSGWFSCRSICYLAAGRPVVVQDTGWSDVLPAGEGMLAFTDLDSAREAIEAVERDYEFHCNAARRMAETYFEGTRVVGDMLRVVGLDPERAA